MKSLILILGILTGLEVQAEILELRFHGGAIRSYVDDRLTLKDDGTAELKTLSPFPYSLDQNVVGIFSKKLDVPTSQKLRDESSKLFGVKASKPLRAGNSILGEISIVGAQDKKGFVWSLESEPLARNLETLFYELKAKILEQPKAALTLRCKRSAKLVQCLLKNIGSEIVHTVDPMGVTESIFCVDQDGRRGVMNPGEEVDPRKMSPKHLQLKKDEEFLFSIDDHASCHTRILVKTSDLLVNANYKNALLGELVSNKLEK
ncbi:MAG: hypothetical protein EOP06_01340 [Proteobacteria bacterium]|nr:MAG: hypothetical protein EOP06_01340 [Pseudomonadota bacterium]